MAHLSVCQASLSTRVLIPGTQGGKKEVVPWLLHVWVSD